MKLSKHCYAVIMAGGRGERFWPLSTSKHPKQLITLFGGKPLLRIAIDRLRGLIPPERILVITRAALVSATARIAPSLPKANIIGEPFGRDTTAACALASAIVKARDPDGLFCVLTADHVIRDIPQFQNTLRRSFDLARSSDVLITIGLTPSRPETGYGYIEAGSRGDVRGGVRFRKATRYVEKPDLATARKYVRSGRYFWNSGMFIWSVRSFQNALARFAPDFLAMADRLTSGARPPAFSRRLAREYRRIKRISVDYAVMEKADNIVMAIGAFDWDDVGSWPAVENHFAKDPAGNVLVGACQVLDAGHNIVVSGSRLTALIGVKDLVVIQSDKATLVCARNRSQDVREMARRLAAQRRFKALT